jgi:hypothetical protein
MKRFTQGMSPEETAETREEETDKRKKLRQAMSPEEASKTRAQETDGKRRIRQVMSPEEKAKIREKETKKRKRLSPEEKAKIREKETKKRKRLTIEKNDAHCIKEAKKYLHRSQDSFNPHKHKSIVCVVCDQFIIGTETIYYLSKNNINAHGRRLSVESYERYYDTKLKHEVRNQYVINDVHLKVLLLSPQSRKTSKGYSTCSCCFSGMQPNMANKKSPPKFALANGFVFRSFPQKVK